MSQEIRYISICILLFIAGFNLFAQEETIEWRTRPNNNVYLNLLGDASIISVCYERLWLISPVWILSGKLGLGYNEGNSITTSASKEQFIMIPHNITCYLGKKRHFFEFGIGGTLNTGEAAIQRYLLYPIAGYRIQPLRTNKLMFRLSASIPFSGLETKDFIFVPFGIGMGLSF